ncbi:PilZ domain-containing protein [Sulfurimonas sp. SAG-AH-194-C21]|nr:PilZ domain-containing protein [Sulfurimonas sp. SAG-AH-194-C21]MDF1883573.1 PilZ domain-containing protein [Sulfurimonas sp. SAG-AH-194-C21]
MRLCYLYSQDCSYPYIDTLLNAFDCTPIDINTTDLIDDYEIYIIDLQDVDKNISKKLIDLFSQKGHVLVYFIIPKKYTLILFQLAFRLNAKSIITQSQNIDKLISKIQADEKVFVHTNLEKWLGNIKINTQNFFIYKYEKLIYINERLLAMFNCKSEEILKEKILSQVDMQVLLSKDTKLLIDLSDAQQKSSTYEVQSLTISDSDKLIYINKTDKRQEPNSFLSSRFLFVEILKEKILEKDISESHISLLTIGIENSQQLTQKYGIIDFENQLCDLVSYINTLLNDTLVFAQFQYDFYVILFDNTTLEGIHLLGDTFYTKVLSYINSKDSEVLLNLFTFNLDNKELNNILSILHEIQSKTFLLTQEHQYIRNITSKTVKNTVQDVLASAFENKTKLTILNIYHGLVIHTSSKILKVTQDSIYISFESLQGIVLKDELKTVLQSDYFSNDIYADVKQINLSKKIAVLENFKFLKTNANAREYARVTPSIKIPITVNTKKNVFNGVILDLSIKSIAIRTKHQLPSSLDKLSIVTLVFNLLDQSSENGYIQLRIDAKIILVTNVDQEGYYKVICDLEQDTHDVDIILKYVYERQKELIIELKKMSKLN